MKFDSASAVETVVWDMRLADEPRASDRAVLQRLYNGAPPFDEATAEENNIMVNINDLTGTLALTRARTQWNNAFLKPSRFFIANTDAGPPHKRGAWSSIVTKQANTVLKKHRRMLGQIRSTGANTMLYGIGPVNWQDRRSVVPRAIPVGSLMIPSETEIDDIEDLSYFAIFREYTLAQLYEMTHGTKVDPGWNMKLVQAQFDYLRDELRKSPNSLAYQYMPERIEELVKQDKGYFGSDAVPTTDVWDFYFRDPEKDNGWFRRVILDWGTGVEVGPNTPMPASRNKVDEKSTFLYTSGNRKYANHASEIIHCNFGDCSAYAPFKYHSIRSLGWMLWGVCDLQNRLHCKFNEAVFEQLMWFFQTAGNQDLMRLKKANFEHMGIIPQGIRFLTAQERFTPNMPLVQMAFNRNQKLISDSSTTYSQDYEKGSQEPRTATETMALVNASQAMASGILELAYTYEGFKYREMFRRLCLKNNTDPLARKFRLACLTAGVPEEVLDVEQWNIEPEQVIGGGNKTVQMATVGFLNNIRANLTPDGQRMVDHMSVEAATDQPDLAEMMAPIGEEKPISNSTHDAQLATERLMRGLPFYAPKEAVHEDYVTVWLHDLGMMVEQIIKNGSMAKPEELNGMMNMSKHIAAFLEIMGSNPSERAKVREFNDAFSQLTDHIKALAQRLQQQMEAQAKQGAAGNGDGSAGAKEAARIQGMIIQAQTKAKIAENSAAARTRQKEEQFQKAEARKDQQTAADIQREGIRTRHELAANRLKSLAE